MRYVPQFLQPVNNNVPTNPKPNNGLLGAVDIEDVLTPLVEEVTIPKKKEENDNFLDEYVGTGMTIEPEPDTDNDDQPDSPFHRAWFIWTSISDRPYEELPSPESESIITEALKEWEDKPEHELETTIRSAVYLPITRGDHDDIHRLVNALTQESTRTRAQRLSADINALPFKLSDREELESRFTVIAELCGVNPDSLDDDQTDMLWTLSEYDDKEVNKAAKKIKETDDTEISPQLVLKELGDVSGNLFQSVAKENRATIASIKKMNDNSRLMASAPDDLSVIVHNDLQSRDMLTSGYSTAVIGKHHSSVPEGYWARVDEEIVKPGAGDLMDVYDLLEDEFDFHAEDRDVPAKE